VILEYQLNGIMLPLSLRERVRVRGNEALERLQRSHSIKKR
jgi:hypothetical protein